MAERAPDPLAGFHPAVRAWFTEAFPAPTRAQSLAWPAILAGESTLLLAPTGSGKTLAAFLVALERVMFAPVPAPQARCRVVYVSPLKALAVDVERNLRAPLAGIAAVAARLGVAHHAPVVALRTGDTPAAERARLRRTPPDILITTPESLFLMLTSEARETLRDVDAVLVDEIHAVVGTKRGAHLLLSLERLEALRRTGARPLQRVGLSATQRPLDEIARALGGGTLVREAGDAAQHWQPRPVTVLDAGTRRALDVRVEVPVDDMALLGTVDEEAVPSGPAAQAAPRRSIWPSLHPRLVALVRAHRSTMIFVNARRLAERLATAINEEAGEELALAHHGSIAREQRAVIEERLKTGRLPAIVATSSLELGLDLGDVDLVIQISAPPSVAAGLQRVGRASHQVGGVPSGVFFPKFRGDLLACTAVVEGMREGSVEATAYPRSPLDVLAQQIVAILCDGTREVESLYALVRGAAPFAELPRSAFEGVLDMLSGRYPSDDLASLRPRVHWDRVAGTVRAREGAQRVAIANAGTIPDRGLYGVFLAGADERSARRVGELDEEMVHETREGEVIVLGASSWRVESITRDRVLVSPAPGEPGKMPFWRADGLSRSRELGEAIGRLTRRLATATAEDGAAWLAAERGLDASAARNLVAYVHEQRDATGEVPSDAAIVVERFRDELGDWRVCVLSPFGGRVHAPWAMCVQAALRGESELAIETTWTDDGMVFRLPESDEPPPVEAFLPDPDELEDRLVRILGGTSMFAARFREAAGRALLLPRRAPGKRSPLWAQRKRAADLLASTSRHPSFPIVLETYRELLRDIFDLPGLIELLRRVRGRAIRVVPVDSRRASPFASSILAAWVGTFLYDGDAPLAERRAQALAVDHAQLRELLGEAELRELLDPEAIDATERALQWLDRERPVASADGVHDLLRVLGDLTRDELAARVAPGFALDAALAELVRERRACEVGIASTRRFVAAEDAGRYRDALGVVPPRGLPVAFLEPVPQPLEGLLARFARTHGPFPAAQAAARFGLGIGPATAALDALVAREKLVLGALLPGGRTREYCDAEVLRALKRRSLARLRRAVEPVAPEAHARLLLERHGLLRKRRGLDALLDVVAQLQGAPLVASALEREVLPARLEGYTPAMLDTLTAAGEIAWRGLEPLAPADGRIALYLADHLAALAPVPVLAEGALQARIRALLAGRGALFFADLLRETAAFPADLLAALWDLVWAGEATNDTFQPLRSLLTGPRDERRAHRTSGAFRSRRVGPPGSEGRWSLLPDVTAQASPTPTERRAALARQLLERHGVLVREAVHAEGHADGFAGVYPVLKALEDSGRVRRGYFVAGLGATQFAQPGADDRLRALRDASPEPQTLVLAATDPANPWGAALRWPERTAGSAASRPQRAAGARVVLVDGALVGWLGRGGDTLLSFLPEEDVARDRCAAALATALAAPVDAGTQRAAVLATIDGAPASLDGPLGRALAAAGFAATSRGLFKRGPR
jgi:ATP-dependent Lhr-like helicase